jgi:hypothetical protein
VQIVSLLGARRRDMKAAAGERLLQLAHRDALSERRLVAVAARLGAVEEQLESARVAGARREANRRERLVQLRGQVELLRIRAGARQPPRGSLAANASGRAVWTYQLGSALMYLGGLLLLWVVLLELGLALGLG